MAKSKATIQSLPVFLVTCAKSPPDRLESAQRELSKLGLLEQLTVISGATAEDAEIDTLYDPKMNRKWLKRPLARAEVAIYASHRRAWQTLLDSGAGGALILEDDFLARDPHVFQNVLMHWPALLGDGRDIVKLFDFQKKRGPHVAEFSTELSGISLAKWRRPTAGMVAYLISKEGARKFLSRQRIFRQVDEDTKYYWELGLNIWSVPGCPIIDNSMNLGGSLVDQDRQAKRRRSLTRSLWGNFLSLDRKLRTRWHLALERRRSF